VWTLAYLHIHIGVWSKCGVRVTLLPVLEELARVVEKAVGDYAYTRTGFEAHIERIEDDSFTFSRMVEFEIPGEGTFVVNIEEK
jgi:hypothetical protein